MKLVRSIVLMLVLGLGAVSQAYLHNLVGTPFLYQPEAFTVDPTAPSRNGPAYQAQYGYRGVHFLEQLNQKSVEGNPKLYDPTYIKTS